MISWNGWWEEIWGKGKDNVAMVNKIFVFETSLVLQKFPIRQRMQGVPGVISVPGRPHMSRGNEAWVS